MTLFRACILADSINGNELNKEKLEALSGFVKLKVFGSEHFHSNEEKTHVLFEFDIDGFGDIEDIHGELVVFNPVYCFSENCPRQDLGCPAFDRK